MTALRFTIRPKAPFGSPLLGETLFGQLCWAILRLYGKERCWMATARAGLLQ